MEGRGPTDASARAVVYCIVPRELAGKLHEPLRRHFAGDEAIEVVVEQRTSDRRAAAERRRASAYHATPSERRRIRAAEGRRVADRRAATLPVDAARPLPRRARPYAARLLFIERLEPTTQGLEDVETARLVARIQAGDRELFSELYLRYFDRVYGYLNIGLRNAHEAEDVTQLVFLKALQALPRYERRTQPFRAWLFQIARHALLDTLEKLGRPDPIDPNELSRSDPSPDTALEPTDQLAWITDRELLMFVERLPLSQRQVLVLKYLLGMTTAEIASVLHRNEPDVRRIEFRALEFLRRRLAAVRKAAPQRERGGLLMRRRRGPAVVLRERRFAIHR